MAVNRKPIIHGTDAGIWSRIRLIRFSVSFDGREDRTCQMETGVLSECFAAMHAGRMTTHRLPGVISNGSVTSKKICAVRRQDYPRRGAL
jgi:hypothetical protein